MNPNHSIDVEAERKLFEREMNAQRFFPAELDFTRGKSPSGRDEYVNSHLQSNWNGWLAAKRSIAQPASEAVATVLYWQTERSAGWEFNWLGKPPVAGTEIDLFAAPVPAAQPAADPAPVPANTGTIGDDAEFMRLLTGLNHLTRNADTDARWEAAAERQRELIAHIDARLNAAPICPECRNRPRFKSNWLDMLHAAPEASASPVPRAQGGSTNEWGDEAPPVDGDALTCYKCGIDRTKAACAEPWTCPMSVMTPGVVLTQKQASEKRLNELHSADPFMDEPWYKKYSAYMDRLLPAMMIYSGEEVSAKMATAAQGIDHAKLVEKLANNYVCGSVVSDFQGPKITLRYQTTAAADSTFDAITDLIDAQNAGGQARGQQAGEAESFAVVPRRMTDAMRDAGNEILLDRCKLNLVWSAMLDSAPSIDLNAFIRSMGIGSDGNTKGGKR